MDFKAPFMAVRKLLLQQAQPQPVQNELTQWPGEVANFPVIWNPKLRTNAMLKSFGGWGENITAHFPRADTRVFLYRQMRGAVTPNTQFQGGSETRGIPAVFVPTSLGNSYSGRSSM